MWNFLGRCTLPFIFWSTKTLFFTTKSTKFVLEQMVLVFTTTWVTTTWVKLCDYLYYSLSCIKRIITFFSILFHFVQENFPPFSYFNPYVVSGIAVIFDTVRAVILTQQAPVGFPRWFEKWERSRCSLQARARAIFNIQ